MCAICVRLSMRRSARDLIRCIPVFAHDAVLAPGRPRPALEVHPDHALTLEGTRGHPYFGYGRSRTMSSTILPAGTVLLHIDMITLITVQRRFRLA